MTAAKKTGNAFCLFGLLLDADRCGGEPGGLYILNGVINKVLGPNEPCPDKSAEVLNYGERYIAPSFIDMFGWVGSDKQQLMAEQAEAALGGYTHLLCFPHKDLPLDKSEHVLWLRQQSEQTELLPVASLLGETDGKVLMNKLNKLHLAGAVAFSQGRNHPDNNRIILNCYEYLQSVGGLLIVWPVDRYLGYGFVTTGAAAWRTGLPAASPLAETLAVQRHLMLVRAAGVRTHFGGLSCAESLKLLADAPVSRDVSLAHLCFCEEKLYDYDNTYYTEPPLRSEEMRVQLWNALSGTDAIGSMHYTRVEDDLQMPLQNARAGLATRSVVLPLLLEQVLRGSSSLTGTSSSTAIAIARFTASVGGAAG